MAKYTIQNNKKLIKELQFSQEVIEDILCNYNCPSEMSSVYSDGDNCDSNTNYWAELGVMK